MVARVNSGKNILGILNYNENKVKKGNATCIHENLFGQLHELTFNDKRNGFKKFTDRNMRATSKAIHISLNFHKSENLEKDQLAEIASVYMDKIGFGDQPYLVYQHFDAAHPHVHIVTTNIQRNGKRIAMYNIGKNQSEKARKEIETTFSLVKASGHNVDDDLKTVWGIKAVVYGQSETKRELANVVRFAVKNYRYSSLPELNAVLGQFNVIADGGKEGSLMRERRGLVYSVLDKNGNKEGVPIKASSIYGKPTLAFLEKQFKINELERPAFKSKLKSKIDYSLLSDRMGEGIGIVFRKNETGRIYGVTFVDHEMKVVFNGSDLGKEYSASALLGKFSEEELMTKFQRPAEKESRQDQSKPLKQAEEFFERKRTRKKRGRGM